LAEESKAEIEKEFKELRAVVDRGVLIERLLASEGWKIIQAWLNEEIGVRSAKFRRIKKDENFYRLQGEVSVLEKLKEKPLEMVDEMEWALEQLKDLDMGGESNIIGSQD
jgi:molecular chaperone GrpE (heat shock protein)